MSNSGPPYPPSPQTIQQNQIGSSFEIGVSPIGTIVPFSYWDTIISQYANSTVITTLIGNFNSCIDQTQNMDLFYDDMMNVATASGYGLDVWGRIVGVTRVVTIQTPQFFGFNEQIPSVQDFGPGGTGTFYTGVLPTSNFTLSDNFFRKLIYAKALTNISNGSSAAINQILLALFPFRGNAFVIDNNNMTMIYAFNFVLSNVELAVVEQTGVLPKPTGVSATFMTGPFTLLNLLTSEGGIYLTDETGLFLLEAQ